MTILPSADFTVGLVTALVDPELTIALKTLASLGWKESQSDAPEQAAGVRTFKQGRLTLFVSAIGEAGQAASGIETLIFMERCLPSPRVVFLCGIGGSLRPDKVAKKDVVVASAIHWKTHDKIEGLAPTYAYRAKVFPTPPLDVDFRNGLQERIVQLFPAHEDGERGFRVRFGEVFTGNYVVSSEGYVSEILSRYPEAQCCEMEAGGFVSALSRHSKAKRGKSIVAIVVRGISDNACNKDNDPDARAAACRNAATVVAGLATDMIGPHSRLLALLPI